MTKKRSFTAWLATARLNEAYAYGPEDLPGIAVAEKNGVIFLSQRRIEDGFEKIARRCRPQDRTVLDAVSRGIKVAPSSDFLKQVA